MIGTKVRCVLWTVVAAYLVEEPGQEPKEVSRRFGILTADPAGCDVHQVAELVLRGLVGKANISRVVLVSVERQGEIAGLATIDDDVARFVQHGTFGAAILQATESHRATIGELRRELALSEAGKVELRARLEGAYATLRANGFTTPPLDEASGG